MRIIVFRILKLMVNLRGKHGLNSQCDNVSGSTHYIAGYTVRAENIPGGSFMQKETC